MDAFIVHGRQWSRTERFEIPDGSSPPNGFAHMAMALVGKFGLKCLPDLFTERDFAERALATLESQTFDQDLDTLLSGRCGQWITGIQNGITSLNDQELESLTSSIKSESIQSALKTLHQNAASTNVEGSLVYRATHQLLRSKLDEIITRNQ